MDLDRGARKSSIQELPMSVLEEMVCKHQCRGSSRSDTMQGPLEENSNRISTRSSHEGLYKIMYLMAIKRKSLSVR